MRPRRVGTWLAVVRLLLVAVLALVVAESDFPPGWEAWGWALVLCFAAAAAALLFTTRLRLDARQRRIVRALAIAADGVVALAVGFLFAFQSGQPLRTLYLVPVVEAALRFGTRGGLVSAVLVAPFVPLQELFQADRFDGDVSWGGVAVRLLIVGFTAAIVGGLSDELDRQRARAVARADEAEALRDQLGQRVDALEAANRCARALASSLELDEAFGAFLRELRGLIPYDRASVLLEEGGLTRVLITAGLGNDAIYPSGSTWPSESSILGELRRRPRTIYREDFAEPQFAEEERLLQLGLRARVVAPLEAGGELVGALAVLRTEPRSFRHDEIELLTLLARLVAHTVQNVRSYDAERRTVEELRRLSALRADFVSLVSHELRSPMAAVIGSARTLQQRWRELAPEQRDSFLALIADETGRLADLIGDVLDTSRIEAGTFSYTFTDVDVGAVVEEAVAAATVAQDEVAVRVSVAPGLPTVRGDRERLRQVLVNLIDNAVKYSNAGEAVDVRAWSAEGYVRVDVRDRGPGIPRDEQGLIFEKFGRAGNASGRPGTGLGLFIARSIAEAHGGSIEVDSRPGEGALFTLALPAESVRSLRAAG